MNVIKNFERAGVIVAWRDHYLVVQGRKSNKWSFPKGHREGTETPYETAARELYEEAGIKLAIHKDRLLLEGKNYDKIITYYKSQYVYFLYNIDDIDMPPRAQTYDKKEVKFVGWVFIDDLKSDKYNKNCTLKLFIKSLPVDLVGETPS